MKGETPRLATPQVKGWRREWDSCRVAMSEVNRPMPEDHSDRRFERSENWRREWDSCRVAMSEVNRPMPEDHSDRRFERSENWRREWDSNSHASFRFCNLQIPQCHGCRECRRCRGALPAIARGLSRSFEGDTPRLTHHRVAAPCEFKASALIDPLHQMWR